MRIPALPTVCAISALLGASLIAPSGASAQSPVASAGTPSIQGVYLGAGTTQAPGEKHDFRPLSPARILDTRPSQGGAGPVSAFQTKRVQVTGRGGVPASATSVVLNVTVTEARGSGFVTLFPAGESKPTASNLNFAAGDTTPNQVVVKVGAGGAVDIYSHATTHVIVDVLGYFEGTSANQPLTPSRLMDTRENATLAALRTRKLKVTGVGGVPSSGVGAVIVNVTVTNATAPGYVTAYPADQARPTASNLNYVPGKDRAVLAVVPVSAAGEIALYTHSQADVIVDVVGALRANPRFTKVTPRRVLDSRNDTGAIKRKIKAGETLMIDPGAPEWAFAASLNITAVNPSRAGFFTVFPTSSDKPTASNVNYVSDTVANSAMVKLGPDGKFQVFSLVETDIVIDVSGFFGGPVEWQLLDKVNRERKTQGLNELKMADCLLHKMSRPWAKHMAETGDYRHQDLNPTFTLCDGASGAAENIAYGYGSIDGVMDGWMNSDGHRDNILTPWMTHFGGAAHKDSTGRWYWVQNFTKM